MLKINNKTICSNCFAELQDDSAACVTCGGVNDEYIGTLPSGTILLGKYAIGKVLGRGGFGVTYLAYDLNNDKIVAIKEYLPDRLAYRMHENTKISTYKGEKEDLFKNGAEKFYEEAKTVSRFNGHPNIINVYEFFYENNTAYFVMEYVDGIDFKKYIKQNGGRLPYEKVIKLLTPIFDALIVVHSVGVLHRDISPDNIFISKTGDVKLLDFGAARQVIGEQSKSLSVILKQGFAPIEQYQKKGKQGPWTDIYALGATIYYAIFGSVPEDAMSRLEDDEVEKKIIENAEMSNLIKPFLIKMLAVNIDNRYRSVIEAKTDLQKAIENPYAETVKGYDYTLSENETAVDPSYLQTKEKNKEEYMRIKVFVGKNYPFYAQQFLELNRSKKKTSWNWAAFFVGGLWALTRGIFGWGILLMITAVINSTIMSNVDYVGVKVFFAMIVLCINAATGAYSNYWYKKRVEKKLHVTLSEDNLLLDDMDKIIVDTLQQTRKGRYIIAAGVITLELFLSIVFITNPFHIETIAPYSPVVTNKPAPTHSFTPTPSFVPTPTIPVPTQAVVVNKKMEFMNRLKDIQLKQDNTAFDGTMAEMKTKMNRSYEEWDKALNDIYQYLKETTPASEFEKIKQEELQWITNKEKKAKDDAAEFEGGSMYDLEYTSSLVNSTKERCYILIEYIK